MQQLLICPLPLVLFLCDLSSTLKQDDLLKNKTGSCHFSIYNLSIISHFYLCRVQIPWHVLQNYLLIFPISPFLSSCSMAQPYWSYFSSSKTLLSFWICTAMFLVFLEILAHVQFLFGLLRLIFHVSNQNLLFPEKSFLYSKFWLGDPHLCSYTSMNFLLIMVFIILYFKCVITFLPPSFRTETMSVSHSTPTLITMPSTKYMLNKYLPNKLMNGGIKYVELCLWKAWVYKTEFSSTTKLGSSSFNFFKMLTETGHILRYSILMSIYFLLLPGRSLMEYS